MNLDVITYVADALNICYNNNCCNNIKEGSMSDLGDLFDMFSQDGDEEKKQRNAQENGANDKAGATDTKTQIMNKVKQNKVILFTGVVFVILAAGTAGYFLIRYVGDHGIKSLLDIVAPFIQ